MNQFLTNLYYISTLVFLFNQLEWIIKPHEKLKEIKKTVKVLKFNSVYSIDMTEEDKKAFKDGLLSALISLFIAFWMIVGLFTSQWEMFLSIIIFNLMIVRSLGNLLKDRKSYVYLHWTNSLIGLFFGIFIVVNHYHLHLSFTDIIKNLLN